MFASKFLRFVLIAWLSLGCRIAFAQAPIQQHIPIIRTSISLESGFLRFQGDAANCRFSNGNTNLGMAFNLHYSSWRLSFNASSSKFAWNEQANLGRNNFQCSMQSAGVMVGRFLFNSNEGKRFNPFAMLGISGLRSNTKSDLFDKNGIAYHYWNDGSIRDIPESFENTSTAVKLTRDYSYETSLALGQKSLCFPIELGISASLSPRASIEVSWKDLLIQSD